MSAVLAASTAPQRVEQTPGRRALRRLLRRRTAVFGLVVVVLMALLALFAPWIAPFDPLAKSFAMVRKAPSAAHWFGTDEVGRDLLARVIYGGRASLAAGVIAVSIAVGCGVPLGMLAGANELANRPAIVDVPVGRGHVVMFATNPMWRHQTQGEFFLLFNAALNFDNLGVGRQEGRPQRQTSSAVDDDQ